ncbi:MAG: DNA-directed RNA polymerase subunit alpha [Patescibacteria group bacterium]|nr:DNA-directed RNA polymerase subunit alpha [Patescibacteria group bacterium]MDE2589101.1 DNA-directed RNA polymerase subunit alpha [Patescibacteria group bacterium]
MIDPIFTVKEVKNTGDYGQFVIGPLEPGYGYTLGHAMRRILLTSIPGASITSVKINGVKHRFSQLPGLKENIVDFLLNLKGLSIKLNGSKKMATLKLSVKGPKEVTGEDVEATDGAEVVNKDHYLGYLSDKKLDMEMTVEEGYGYSLAEDRSSSELGVIQTDAIFTPIQRVNYSVRATRVGRRTDMDELVMDVWTNGSVDPKAALDETAKLLSTYFAQVYEPKAAATIEGTPVTSSVSDDLLKLTIDELDLPTRIYNSLRNGGIETVGQLLSTQRKDLVSMRNMGAKSISVIEEKLKDKGISLTV